MKAKNTLVWSLHRRCFSTLIASNLKATLTMVEEKVSKKEKNRYLSFSQETLQIRKTGSVLQNGYSEKFGKFPGKQPWLYILFFFYNQKHSTTESFLKIFSNLSEEPWKINRGSFLFYKSSQSKKLY